MFHTSEKSTGTAYTTPVALLCVAFVFVPLVLVVSRPFEYWFALLAACASLLCVILAWRAWTKNSGLTIPSIVVPNRKGE